jgi:type I restriction enzyme S subunit
MSGTTWPLVTLGELGGRGQYGLNAAAMVEGTGVRYIRITDIDQEGRLGRAAPAFVPDSTPDLDRFTLRDGDILIARSGATAGKSYMHEGLPGQAVFAGYLIRFQIDRSVALPAFIRWFLRTEEYRCQLKSHTRTVAQPNVNAQGLASLRIPLPSLAEQQRIVRILDEADALRRLRECADRRTAQLVPALFDEMFGSPTADGRPWPVRPLRDLVARGDKVNYGVVQPGPDFPGGIPIVRVGDFADMCVSGNSLKTIDPKIESAYRRSRLVGDEVLVACVGSIGKIALADKSLNGCNIVRAVARIRCSGIDRCFLAWYLSTPAIQHHFTAATRTVNQPTLNIAQIQETPVLVPPADLQSTFAARVAEVRAMEEKQAESRRRLDDLFQSLLHRAFRGEL